MDYFKMEIPGRGITFEVDRFRRERHELFGELTVRCNLKDAQTYEGILNRADFNFSSVRARQDRAKLLKERSRTNGSVDWFGLIEEVCHRLFEKEQVGIPAVNLRTLSRPQSDDEHIIEGLGFPQRHPSCLFGDGGAAKSYTALYIAGILAQRGLRVGLFDWELCGEDHRDRLERLFGADMPDIIYARCERPLTIEAERLSRISRDHQLDFSIYDSVAFACDGPPESAEIAGKYFRAVREIGGGSLHLAHINRSETSDSKPFGSSFWHNGFRSTWFVEAKEGAPGVLHLGFHHRKCNLGALRPATSFAVRFDKETTRFFAGDIMRVPELAEKLPLHKRMYSLLRRGSMTIDDIAKELDADTAAVRKAVQRGEDKFIKLSDGSVGLKVSL